MRGLSDRGRIQFLLAIMAVVAVITASISLWLLYQTALDEQRSRLVETAQSQARLIEAVARFDAVYSRTDFPGGAGAATLSQISDAHERYQGFGETGEFTLARREHDSIVFLLSHRHYDLDTPTPMPWESDLAEPMRRALSGQSGTLIGPDYRGVSVLAAYEPVAELDLGIVAKIDMAEIREPFIRAAGLSGLGVLFMIGLGVVASRRIGTPMVERLKAEEALKASETQLRLLIDNLPALIVYMDTDQRFRLVNRTCAAWYDRPAAEIIGKQVSEIHGERYAVFKPHIDAVLSGETVSIEAEAVYPDGEMRDIRSVLVPHVDTQGTVRGYFALTQDITQSKLAEKEMRESEERFRAVVEGTAAAISLKDAEGKFLLVNERFASWFGTDPSNIVGREVGDFFDPQEMLGVEASDAEVLAGRDSIRETDRTFPDGVRRSVVIHKTPVTGAGGTVTAIATVLTDITQRKRAEDALRGSEARFRDFAETASDWFWETDMEQRYTYYAGAVPGIDPIGSDSSPGSSERFIGRTRYEIWGELQGRDPDAINTIADYMARGAAFDHLEISHRDPEHGLVHIYLSGKPVTDDGGNVVAYRGTGQNITERKRAEEALRNSEERLRRAILDAPVPIMLHTEPGEVLMISKQWARITGYTHEDIPTINEWTNKAYGGKPPIIAEALEKAYSVDADNVDVGTFVVTTASGEKRTWTFYSSRLGTTAKGDVLLITTAQDITDQKRVEEDIRELNESLERRVEERTIELRESELRLRGAMEAIPAGFALYDREDHLVMCNEGYHQQVFHDRVSVPYGMTFEEILSDKLARGHYPETDGREAEWLAERLQVHNETSGPIEQMHSNGHWYWINERQINEGSTVVISADITERKRMENELLRQERLAMLGQLNATVSHELRNPLGVIRTSAFIVRQGLNGETPLIKRSLERIERSVIRCDRIVDELLDFTRIKDIEANPTPIDVWLEKTVNEQTLPSGVELRLEFGMPDITVSFDHDRFRRAIINVFDNGCQAMIGEGREDADSEERVLTVRTQESSGRVEVIFEDTGPGMPPDVYEKIFEPLYSTKGFGVGLGLPVVKQIMEQHGGGIEIESEEGRGTRVCLWLPHGHSTH